MVQELELLIKEFCAENRGRCFLHVDNLIAKSFLKQFDTKKKRGDAHNGNDVELDELVDEVEQEEMLDDGNDDEIDDDLDG